MSTSKRARNVFLAGIAVIVPLAVSAWVLFTLIQTAAGLLSPLAAVFRRLGFTSKTILVGLQLVSVSTVVLIIMLVGSVVQRQFGKRLIARLDARMERIPGLGTVYQTARRMSDLLLTNDEDATGQFQEVKLVEFPGANAYTLGFLTSSSPPPGVVEAARTIEGDATGEYLTLFLPMAPNPVMGGHLTHVPANRVHDVDIDMEHALQYILTTGVVATPDDSDTN